MRAGSNGYAERDGYTYSNLDCDFYGDSNIYTYGYRYCVVHTLLCYPNGHRNLYAICYIYAYEYSNTHGNSYGLVYTMFCDAHCDGDSNPFKYSNPYGDGYRFIHPLCYMQRNFPCAR